MLITTNTNATLVTLHLVAGDVTLNDNQMDALMLLESGLGCIDTRIALALVRRGLATRLLSYDSIVANGGEFVITEKGETATVLVAGYRNGTICSIVMYPALRMALR